MFAAKGGIGARSLASANLDGLSSLSSLTSGARKPLCGVEVRDSSADENLLAHAEPHEAPKRQSTLLGFVTRPAVSEVVIAVASEQLVAETADDPLGVDEDDGGAPSWAASGGMVLEVLEEMVTQVLGRDGGLLDESERFWLAAVRSGSTAARALYARLYARRGVSFTLDDALGYPEVGGNAPAAARELRDAGLARLVSLEAPLDGACASILIEQLAGAALKEACAAAGISTALGRSPLASRPATAAGTSTGASAGTHSVAAAAPCASGFGLVGGAGPVAEQRRLLRQRLALPPVRPRTRPPALTAAAAAAAADAAAAAASRHSSLHASGWFEPTAAPPLLLAPQSTLAPCAAVPSRAVTSAVTSAVAGEGGGRLRPAQRAGVLRRIVTLLTSPRSGKGAGAGEKPLQVAVARTGVVLVLTEAPLAALLLAERLFFRGSYCGGIATAAAAAMGCRSLRPPGYALPPPGSLPPSVPNRAVLTRCEAAGCLGAAYVACVEADDEPALHALARCAERVLRALVARRRAAADADALAEADAAVEELCAVAGMRAASKLHASRELHASEVEGFEQLRATQPLAARMSVGWLCASLLTVQVSLLEKRKR